MTRQLFVTTSLLTFVSLVFWATVAGAVQRKILYVDSYHEAYPWSAGITRGIEAVLQGNKNVELKILRMDTKQNAAEAFKKSAALKVKQFIDFWQPDLVIASDDNAAKYLIVPYFKGGDIPFVFCGVNWDAGDYGFPAANVTGMIEVQMIEQILATLQIYAAGPRIAFLKGDDLSARKEADFFEKRFALQIDKHFVTNFTAWKKHYLTLQQEADMLLLGNSASVKGWDNAEAQAFVLLNTRIPSGNWDDWMAPFSLVTFANDPEEQGRWAATAALKILAGATPAEIPVSSNHRVKIILNMPLAKKLGIKFSIDLIERATFTSEMDVQ
jgi:ABC-type uncharacterized transport system substrate-binding protein